MVLKLSDIEVWTVIEMVKFNDNPEKLWSNDYWLQSVNVLIISRFIPFEKTYL